MTEGKVIQTPDGRPSWQIEMENAGFLRKLFLSRNWYGADWWFAVLSGILLIIIFTIGLFPGLFAPFDPREEVGPSLLAPGEIPPTFVIAGLRDGVLTLDDFIGETQKMGIVIGSKSSQVLRETAEARQDELRAQGQDINLRPRPERYKNIGDAIEGLLAGEVVAIVGLEVEIEPYLRANIELKLGQSLSGKNQNAFILGTNQIGQDILSRLIWGTRIALLVAFGAAVFSFSIGVPLGLIAGFWSGRLERFLTLFMDSLYSFPGLILAIAISSVLGPGVLNVIFAIATLYIPTYYRIARGQTLAIKETLYVEGAYSLGAHPISILRHYIFPNVIPSLVVIFSVNVADAILTEAGLAFIGLGLPPDTPDWGIDLASGQDFMRQAWWLITFPGVMITTVTLAFSMLGESLSEILNPRLSDQ